MKSLLNLKEVHLLSKKEQKTINGGGHLCLFPDGRGYTFCENGGQCNESSDCDSEFAFEQPECINGYCTV
ncbi:hypothetical protein GTQ40_03360 [Flavobacteriaceae bacterium R38]|nr:hypothetical protein [Flavobacteriaceae bacterium R38]